MWLAFLPARLRIMNNIRWKYAGEERRPMNSWRIRGIEARASGPSAAGSVGTFAPADDLLAKVEHRRLEDRLQSAAGAPAPARRSTWRRRNRRARAAGVVRRRRARGGRAGSLPRRPPVQGSQPAAPRWVRWRRISSAWETRRGSPAPERGHESEAAGGRVHAPDRRALGGGGSAMVYEV